MAGGGSQGKGSTKYDKWSEYVPPEVYATFKNVLPKLAEKYDVGLTPEEKQYYTGQMVDQNAKSYATATKGLSDTMARTGTPTASGAALESSSDLLRGKIGSEAVGHSAIQGMDISKKSENTDRLLKMMMSNYDPQAVDQSQKSSSWNAALNW